MNHHVTKTITKIAAVISLIVNSVGGFSGDLTAYGANLNGGFCGFNEKSWTYNGVLTAAVNQPQIDNSLTCGLCAIVSYNSKSTVVLIDNVCPECKYGDLDLSQQSWKAIVGDTNYRREKATWEFIDCASFLLTDGSIQLRPHHVNYWWLAVNPSSMKCGVSAMELWQGNAWVSMVRDNSQMNGLWFIHHAQVQTPFRFRMHSHLGDVVETQEYTEIQQVWNTGLQFKCDLEQDCDLQQSNTNATAQATPTSTPKQTTCTCV